MRNIHRLETAVHVSAHNMPTTARSYHAACGATPLPPLVSLHGV